MRNSENIKVLISEAMRWDIDERELYSRRKLEIQRQREEIQEKDFQKEQKNGEKKTKCSCKKQSNDIVKYSLGKSARECKLTLKDQTKVMLWKHSFATVNMF